VSQVNNTTELSIHLGGPLSGINDLEDVIRQLEEDLPRAMARALEEHQEEMVAAVVGHRHQRTPGIKQVICPRCGGTHFHRGNLQQVGILTSKGKIRFNKFGLRCDDCGRTIFPFAPAVGRHRATAKVEEVCVDLATRMSYREAAQVIKLTWNLEIPHEDIHALVQRHGTAMQLPQAGRGEVQVLMLDSTKAPAGKKSRGTDVFLAVGLTDRQLLDGRPAVGKLPVALVVSDSRQRWEQVLSDLNPSLVLTDDDPYLVDLVHRLFPHAVHQLRLFHFPRTLGNMLWKDGVAKEGRLPHIEKLRHILYLDPLPWAEERLQLMQVRFRRKGWTNAAGLLQRAQNRLLAFREHPDRTLQPARPHTGWGHLATSVIERQMREINARSEIGCHWSIQGLEHLLRLRIVRRLCPRQWSSYWAAFRRSDDAQTSLPSAA
jgi:predicted nucleic-acid-binding Zn-ribbon protein